jgi:hypothetical protein
MPIRVVDEVKKRMFNWYDFLDHLTSTLSQVGENLQVYINLLHFLDSVAVDANCNGECECLASKNGDLIDLQDEV